MKSFNKTTSFAKRLASYGAMGAAFMATAADTNAQCATVGAPLPVDIDGDGTADVTLNVNQAFFTSGYNLLGSFATTNGGFQFNPQGFTTVTAFATFVPGQTIYTNFLGTCMDYAASTGIVGVFLQSTATFLYQNYYTLSAFALSQGVASATGGGNAIVGATNGASCGVFGSAGPANLGSFTNTAAVLVTGTYSYIRTDATFYYFFFGVNALNGTCLSSGGNLFAGYNSGSLGSGSTIINTSAIATNTVVASTSTMIVNPGSQFIAVQFDNGGTTDTFNGWVEVAQQPDGSVCVVSSGYQQCSVEVATAAGDADFACIGIGEATNSNAACVAVCPEIASIAADMTDYCAGDDIEVTITFADATQVAGGEDIQVNGVGPDAPIAVGDASAVFTLPAGAVHDGTSCAAQQVSVEITTALCDDGVTALDIDPAVMIFDVNVWTPATLIVMNDGGCGPSVMVAPADCVVANDFDANGATPDFSAETGAGMVTFTLTQDPANPCPAPAPVMAAYDCSMPSCTIDAVGAVAAACDTGADPADEVDDMVTITVNPTGMANDGLGNLTPLAGTYAVTGLPVATTGTFGTPLTETVPADGMTYTITVTYTDPVDGFTCMSMMDVTVDGPCSTPPTGPTINITDPCDCTNGIDTDGDAANGLELAAETIEITGNAAGEGWALDYSAGSTTDGNLVDADGVTPTTATVTDNGDGTYTLTAYVLADGATNYTAQFIDSAGNTIDITGGPCAPCPVNIPTVGEWGLIMLGLLMSITAVVGIRQRREEEVTA